MPQDIPRIDKIAITLPTTVSVIWRGGGHGAVELAGWIGDSDSIMAPLRDPALFATARLDKGGTNILWGTDDQADELRIDSTNLRLIADEQQPFGPAEVTAWQGDIGLSNQEAADLLGIALSTWNSYKAGANIPTAVAIACRAARRDPVILYAHHRPRITGRPRKALAGED